MANKDELGRRGEELAAQVIERAGMRVLERNWRCPMGEIDIVAEDGDELVLVEVKTRSSTGFGHPFEAITAVKQARLRRLAAAWCDTHIQPSGRRGVRIDAIAVLWCGSATPTVEHLKGVC